MSNLLIKEKSPYLLQHKENPVNWYPWCEEAFSKAIDSDKPIFLSIGYSTCHWCHVMAHESFEDKDVADILNKDFICIKVDREERPDIDAVYMNVCQAVTGSGGWPLTVVMTPEQKPFFVGTYFPKHQHYGRPGLIELLKKIAVLWKENREELENTGEQISESLNHTLVQEKQEPNMAIIKNAYYLFQHQFDKTWGGFGSAPKFPTPHNLLFLMEFSLLENQPDALLMAEKTLSAMARGGINDHIGGGFSRYSTDEKWLIPHFEKMLYDNALLSMAYAKGYQITKKSLYAHTLRRTLNYILRELTHKDGGFYCGQDADSEGVEGKYYVFSPKEIDSVLGAEDSKVFCHLYDITEKGNFEGMSIPNRIGGAGKEWQEDDPRLQKLYAYRLQRRKLHKDDKVLLSWNAWTIMALSQGSRILEERSYLGAAIKAVQFIEKNMTKDHHRLYLRWRDGEAAHLGQLDDYAVYCLALLELYHATFNIEFLEKALIYGKQMIALFEDREMGGYYITASDGEKLIARPKETYDGAIPSGNAVAAEVLVRLSHLTGETIWREAAQRQLFFMAGAVENYPAGHSFALLSMMKELYPHKELICTSSSKEPQQLTTFLKNHPTVNLSVLLKTIKNKDALAEWIPFTKEYPIPEKDTLYYLCNNGTCHAPERDLDQLQL